MAELFTNADTITPTITTSSLDGHHRAHEFTTVGDMRVTEAVIRPSSTGTFHVSVWRVSDQTKIGGVDVIVSTADALTTAPLDLSLNGGVTYIVDAWGASSGVTYNYSGSSGPTPNATFITTDGDVYTGQGTGRDVFPSSSFNDPNRYYGFVSLTVAPAALSAALTPAIETDTAPPVGRTKRKAIATVTEVTTAPAVARRKGKALATATETDEAVAITATTPGIRVAIATVTETDEAPAITRTDPSGFLYRLTFPTYPRSFVPVPIGQTARFVLDQAVSIVRINGSLRQFRSPSQTQLHAAGTEGVDWFIGGRIYDQIPNDVAIELRLAGFETERVA